MFICISSSTRWWESGKSGKSGKSRGALPHHHIHMRVQITAKKNGLTDSLAMGMAKRGDMAERADSTSWMMSLIMKEQTRTLNKHDRCSLNRSAPPVHHHLALRMDSKRKYLFSDSFIFRVKSYVIFCVFILLAINFATATASRVVRDICMCIHPFWVQFSSVRTGGCGCGYGDILDVRVLGLSGPHY